MNVGLETDLIQNQTSSISVPPSIIDLLNDSDISLAFTIYRDASLFPIRRAPVGNVSNVIGSQVASMAIPGIPFGTTLPEPINITLRLTNPITGTAEVPIYKSQDIDILNLIFYRTLVILFVSFGTLEQLVISNINYTYYSNLS